MGRSQVGFLKFQLVVPIIETIRTGVTIGGLVDLTTFLAMHLQIGVAGHDS